MKKIPFLCLLAVLSLAFAGAAQAGLSAAEEARVEAFLALLSQKTDLTFVRNGSKHEVGAAISHLRRKLSSAKKKVDTA